jgi:hypothetical protein
MYVDKEPLSLSCIQLLDFAISSGDSLESISAGNIF